MQNLFLKILRKFFSFNWKVTRYIEPSGKNIRVDSGVVEGSEITMFYDPMISKLCTFANERDLAIKEMINALDRYFIEGV